MEDSYSEAMAVETPPFETGIGGQVGGEISVDGTPFKVTTIIAGAILICIIFHLGNFRWHVVL
jgi:hypothetical protein